MTAIDECLGITPAEVAAREAAELGAIPKPEAFSKAEADVAKAQERLAALEAKRATALELGREYLAMLEDIRRRRDQLLVGRDKAALHGDGAAAAREAALGILGDRFTPWFQAGCKLAEALDAERASAEISRIADGWEDELRAAESAAEAFRVEHGLPAAETQTS
ncbi:MAG: hypothetical protein KF791_20820 [Verrucomicrobiae bacterium]|nr:hypothetical protein [Verrucomicrobiae bacterium]